MDKEHGITIGYLLLLAGLLFLYFTKQFNLKDSIDELISDLESRVFVETTHYPRISVLDLAGSILVCRKYRLEAVSKKSWFEILFFCTLMQFGGTLLIAFLLGQPPSWMVSRSAFPAFLLAWWLTFYCPGDIYWQTIKDNSTLLTIVGFFSTISTAHAVTSWGMDNALKSKYHNNASFTESYLICVLTGTIASTGGGILADVLGAFERKSLTFSKPPSLFDPTNYATSSNINRQFYLSVLYYLLVTGNLPFKLPQLDITTAHSVLAIVHIVVYFMSLSAPKLDYFEYLTDSILTISFVKPVFDFDKDKKDIAEKEE